MAKLKPKLRSIALTDTQIFLARDSKAYRGKTHRDLIADLFRKVHKVQVEDHTKLKFEYLTKNGVSIVKVTGALGQALAAL